jgi:hypothetical protein
VWIDSIRIIHIRMHRGGCAIPPNRYTRCMYAIFRILALPTALIPKKYAILHHFAWLRRYIGLRWGTYIGGAGEEERVHYFYENFDILHNYIIGHVIPRHRQSLGPRLRRQL